MPVQIGEELAGVRIAIRDMAATKESQIYNWGIKKDAVLDGGGRGQSRISSGVSSTASFNNNIPLNRSEVNESHSEEDPFLQGFNEGESEDTGLDTAAGEWESDPFLRGFRSEDALRNDTENSGTPVAKQADTRYTEINTEGKIDGGEEIYLRNSSQRIGSANSGGQVSAVEGDAGQTESRSSKSRPADSSATSFTYGAQVSTEKLLGIDGASSNRDLRVIVGGDSAHTQEARRLGQSCGLDVVLFSGGNLKLADKNGTTFEARAYVKGDRVYVRADHPLYTADQLMRHEVGHDRIAKGEVDVNAVRERIGNDRVEQLSRMYAEAYAGADLTAEEIWEEIICDSLADMNIFAGETIGIETRAILSEIGKAAESSKPTAGRGPPVKGKASREYWRTDLTNHQYKRLLEWVKYDIKTSENSITESANWTFRKFDGQPVFAIYSTNNESDPTILYEVKGDQAEFENRLMSDWFGGDNGGTYGTAASFATKINSYGSQQGGTSVHWNSNVHRGNADGIGTLDGKTRERKPERALLNCLENLLRKGETGGAGGKTSSGTLALNNLTEEREVFQRPQSLAERWSEADERAFMDGLYEEE